MKHTFYHGTTFKSAMNILRSGKFEIEKKPKHAFQASLSGVVYLSREFGPSMIIADQRVRDNTKYAILSVELKDPEKIWPDDIELGSLILLGTYDRRLELGIGFDRNKMDYGDFFDKTGKEVEAEVYPALIDDDQTYAYDELWKRLPKDMREQLNRMSLKDLFDQKEWSIFGKRVIDYLSVRDPEYLRKLTEDATNIFTKPDNVIITGGWMGTLGDFQHEMMDLDEDIDPENFPAKLKIKREFPIRCRGIGSGWHYESAKHALAARGVRTR